MAKAFASNKNALGICDRCGLSYKLRELRDQRTNLNVSNLLVCPSCYDRDHEQYRVGQLTHDDPQALRNARPDQNDGVDSPGLQFEFRTDNESVTGAGTSLTWQDVASTDQFYQTVKTSIVFADYQFRWSLNATDRFDSDLYTKVRMRIFNASKHLDQGNWLGTFDWANTTQSYDSSRTKSVREPDWVGMGDPWRVLEWDMRLEANWTGTIDSVRFALAGPSVQINYYIDYIRFEK